MRKAKKKKQRKKIINDRNLYNKKVNMFYVELEKSKTNM